MSKKTDSIEVRLSPELKARLARESAASGTTMSGYVRDLIVAGEGSAKPDGVSPMKLAQTTVLTALPAAILAAVVFGGATATATPQLRVEFAEMDMNGDGVVTADEYAKLLSMDGLDDDLTDQLPAACAADPVFMAMTDEPAFDPAQAAKADLAEMDANGDAKVTYEELFNAEMSARAQDFLHLDADGNGVLDVSEILAEFSMSFDLFEHSGAQDNQPDVGAACIAALEKMGGVPDDLAGDGQALDQALDQDALTHEARLLIAELDANRDGVVSLHEFLAM